MRIDCSKWGFKSDGGDKPDSKLRIGSRTEKGSLDTSPFLSRCNECFPSGCFAHRDGATGRRSSHQLGKRAMIRNHGPVDQPNRERTTNPTPPLLVAIALAIIASAKQLWGRGVLPCVSGRLGDPAILAKRCYASNVATLATSWGVSEA